MQADAQARSVAHLDISLPAPGPAVAYDEYETSGGGDESALAAERETGGDPT